MLRRLPIASAGPIFVFAVTRVVATALAVLGVVIFGLPDNTTAALIIGCVALPWTLLVLYITRRDPEFALNPVVPIVDFSMLVLLEVVAPDTVVAPPRSSSWRRTPTSRASGAAWGWPPSAPPCS